MNNIYKPHIENVLGKIPIATASAEVFDGLIALFSLIIGAQARILQSSVNELYDMISERKDLFRHSVRFNLNQAMDLTDKLIQSFMDMGKLNNNDVLWVDSTSAIEHSVLNDINILYLTTDNILLKHKVKNDKIEAQIIVAYNLSLMAIDTYDRFLYMASKCKVNLRDYDMDYKFGNKFRGVLKAMHSIVEYLVPRSHTDYTKEGGLVRRGLEVIASKVLDVNNINQTTEAVLEWNGVTFDGKTDNSYLPWNTIQENMVRKYFNSDDFTIEELALMLGRTVGAVKTKAYKLGLIKKIS